jgi:hypothetical protein
MALLEFYLAQARFCEDAARVSTDPKIIKSLSDEAARFRALAAEIKTPENSRPSEAGGFKGDGNKKATRRFPPAK